MSVTFCFQQWQVKTSRHIQHGQESTQSNRIPVNQSEVPKPSGFTFISAGNDMLSLCSEWKRTILNHQQQLFCKKRLNMTPHNNAPHCYEYSYNPERCCLYREDDIFMDKMTFFHLKSLIYASWFMPGWNLIGGKYHWHSYFWGFILNSTTG